MLGRRDPLADGERLLPRVYAYVAYRVRDVHEAEDITSEVFERAVRYRDSYDPRVGEPVAWLIGIARRVIADAAARRALHATPMHDDAAAAGDLADDVVDRLAVGAAVATLDTRDRELIGLRYGAQLSTRQIAALTGDRPNAVDVALHRARARLAAILGDDEGERPASVSFRASDR